MFNRSRFRVFLSALPFFLLSASAAAQGSLDGVVTIQATPGEATNYESYPLAAIERPGILPPWSAVATLTGNQSSTGPTFGFSLGLGLGRGWEVLAMGSTGLSNVADAGIGFGRLVFLYGPVELDARFSLPIHRLAPTFQDFDLGPALSYTHDSRWVIGGLGNLVHATFLPVGSLDLPIEVTFGWQPWSHVFLYGATRLADLGIHRARTSTSLANAPVEIGILFAHDRDWDFGVVAMNGDLRHAPGNWCISILATKKVAR